MLAIETDRRPVATGSQVQEQFARMMARVVARYKLTVVPGRSEELVRTGTTLGVSFGYGCKTIRVRTMIGRKWVDWVDFQIGEGWSNELYAFLDVHFGPPSPTRLDTFRKNRTPGTLLPHPMDSFPHTIDRS